MRRKRAKAKQPAAGAFPLRPAAFFAPDYFAVDVYKRQSKDRGCAPVFMAHGMHCLTCPMSTGESIEMACMVHGADADALVKALNDYFQDK